MGVTRRWAPPTDRPRDSPPLPHGTWRECFPYSGAILWLDICLIGVARKLIQESTESFFNRCDLGPQVRFPFDKLHNLVLAKCGCLIVGGTSEQCDHRFCAPIAIATLVYGRQQHGHKLPENPSQHQFLRAGGRHLGSLVAGDRGVRSRVGRIGGRRLPPWWRERRG